MYHLFIIIYVYILLLNIPFIIIYVYIIKYSIQCDYPQRYCAFARVPEKYLKQYSAAIFMPKEDFLCRGCRDLAIKNRRG